jgi:hypothetical protein
VTTIKSLTATEDRSSDKDGRTVHVGLGFARSLSQQSSCWATGSLAIRVWL